MTEVKYSCAAREDNVLVASLSTCNEEASMSKDDLKSGAAKSVADGVDIRAKVRDIFKQ